MKDICACHLRPLQSVQNASARFITRRRKFDQISEHMRDVLHWLPIKQRVDYKISLIVYKCLHNMAPDYLTDMCNPLSADVGRRHLRSSTHGDLKVPNRITTQYGSRSFAVCGPSTWNKLPLHMREFTLSVKEFSKKLKTVLFLGAY